MSLADNAKASVLKHGKEFAAGIIGDLYDEAAGELESKIKSLIPGQVDDMIIDLVAKTYQEELKQLLLAKLAAVS